MSIEAYGRVPFLPETALRALKVYEPGDDRFRSACRAQQALYRERKGLTIGLYPPGGETQRELGSFLDGSDPDANLINAEIAALCRREVAYREDDALIDETRLYRNMLSSHPLSMSLFGPMKLDLKLATAVAKRLCPDFVSKVTDVIFEHSPARRHPAYTADRTAFDVVFKVFTPRKTHGVLAIEVKFTETMNEQPARLRPRYAECSTASGLYKDPDSIALRGAPLQQLWRQHLLASTMVLNGNATEARLLLIAPALNGHVWSAVAQYRSHLNADGPVAFDAITIETVVSAIKRSGAKDIAAALHERYCDFSSLDALI